MFNSADNKTIKLKGSDTEVNLAVQLPEAVKGRIQELVFKMQKKFTGFLLLWIRQHVLPAFLLLSLRLFLWSDAKNHVGFV